MAANKNKSMTDNEFKLINTHYETGDLSRNDSEVIMSETSPKQN